MTLTEQLNRLAEIAPEICKMDTYQAIDYYDNEYQARVYFIADYKFFQEYNSEIEARHRIVEHCKGRLALAWLRDALEQVIEARGWEPGTVLDNNGRWVGQAANQNGLNIVGGYDTPCEALLAALLVALGEGKG